MEWSDHIDYIQSKVAKRLGLLKRVKHLLPVRSREIMYNTMIQPILDYGDIVWGDHFNEVHMNRLQVLQSKAAKIILNQSMFSSSSSALSNLGWKTLRVRRSYHRSLFVFKSLLNISDFNPLRPNSDLSQTSNCNIKSLSVSEVIRIENMITQVQFY